MKINFDGTPGEYTYTEDANGKTAEGIVKVGAQSERDPAAQRAAGGVDRQAGDHGGHLIAHSIGGANDERNLDAQNANVNQIDQRHVEREVTDLAKDPNNSVYMKVSNFKSNGNERPDATMMTTAVRDNTTGKVDVQYHSFQNASHAEQQQWNDIAAANTEVDARQDAGMTQEQRDLANEYAEWVDTEDPGLGSWDYTDLSDETGSTVQDSVDDGMDGGMDDGMDM